jgi:hypothetical protein
MMVKDSSLNFYAQIVAMAIGSFTRTTTSLATPALGLILLVTIVVSIFAYMMRA